jgi:hypothetical protein
VVQQSLHREEQLRTCTMPHRLFRRRGRDSRQRQTISPQLVGKMAVVNANAHEITRI